MTCQKSHLGFFGNFYEKWVKKSEIPTEQKKTRRPRPRRIPPTDDCRTAVYFAADRCIVDAAVVVVVVVAPHHHNTAAEGVPAMRIGAPHCSDHLDRRINEAKAVCPLQSFPPQRRLLPRNARQFRRKVADWRFR